MNAGDRVHVTPLGVDGTVVRAWPDGDRVTVLADCAAQPVVWHRADLTPKTPGRQPPAGPAPAGRRQQAPPPLPPPLPPPRTPRHPATTRAITDKRKD